MTKINKNDLVKTTRTVYWRDGTNIPANEVGLVMTVGSYHCRVAFSNYTRMVDTDALSVITQQEEKNNAR